MSQNLVKAHLGAEQWASLDQALATMESVLASMTVALTADDRQRLIKMGDASEPFCRKALDVMAQNAGILPRDFDVEGMRADLAAHDALNTRLARLMQLTERARDTEMALGSDVMVAALEGYAFLKIAGKGEGLGSLRKELGRRFDNGPRRETPTPTPSPVPTPALA